MNSANLQSSHSTQQVPLQETVANFGLQKKPSLSQKQPSNNHKTGQCYIERDLKSIRPEDFLPIVYVQMPSKHELFSKIVATDELWKTFRQMAAEVFCKADNRNSLEYIPSFPFCFANINKGISYNGQSKIRERLGLSFYSFHDLVEIAEKVVSESDISQQTNFQEK